MWKLQNMASKFKIRKMRAKLSFLTGLICLAASSWGQSSGLNKLDDKGRKDGKWMVYLDHNWKRINDSSKAVYYRYTFYDHGQNIYPMGPCGKKGYKLESKAGNTSNGEKIQMLNGEYKWYDDKGKLSSVHVLKEGIYISCKEYYPNGEVHQFFDYTRRCEGQEQGWYLYVYDKNGKLKLASPTCKDKEGRWPVMRD